MSQISLKEFNLSIVTPGGAQETVTKGRRKTSHLKVVPESLELRERMRAACVEVAARLDRNHPPTKDEMESVARALLESQGLPKVISVGPW